jgi:hypothetical protein
MMYYNLVAPVCLCLVSATVPPLTYRTNVKLEGKLVVRVYYGAPNYDKKSRRDHEYVLVLPKHIDVIGIPGDDFDSESHKNISAIQVVTDAELKPYLNKTVVINGTLSQAMTGHDHTPVILDIKTIQPK